MVDQLNRFASEVTRVAREVGTEGNSAARRKCRAWPAPGRILTDNVNFDGRQPDGQVRNIAEVTTAVAEATFPARSPST